MAGAQAADEVIESVKWVAHAAAKATEAAAPEATETATAAPRRIAGAPTHGYKATRELRWRPSQRVGGGSERRGEAGWRLDSERFRSTPRTCGRFRRILSLL
jgi:hypothetical protein